MKKTVVITGMGAITAIGNTVSDFWNGLTNSKSGAAPITLFDTEGFTTKFACEVKGFDPLESLDRKEARKMDNSNHSANLLSPTKRSVY